MNIKKRSLSNTFFAFSLIMLFALGTPHNASAWTWTQALTFGAFGSETSQTQASAPAPSYVPQSDYNALVSKVNNLEQAGNQGKSIERIKELAYLAALCGVAYGVYKLWKGFTDVPSKKDLSDTENRVVGQIEKSRVELHRQGKVQAEQGRALGKAGQDLVNQGQVLLLVQNEQANQKNLFQKAHALLKNGQANHQEALSRTHVAVGTNTSLLKALEEASRNHSRQLTEAQSKIKELLQGTEKGDTDRAKLIKGLGQLQMQVGHLSGQQQLYQEQPSEAAVLLSDNARLARFASGDLPQSSPNTVEQQSSIAILPLDSLPPHQRGFHAQRRFSLPIANARRNRSHGERLLLSDQLPRSPFLAPSQQIAKMFLGR